MFGDPTLSLRAWERHTSKALAWMREHDEPTKLWRKFGDASAAGVAVLVETRKDSRLEPVLRNAAQFLAPYGWVLKLFAGKKNAEFMRGIVRGWSNVEVQELQIDSMTPKDYSALLTQREFFYLLLPHKHVFFFQTDGWIMAPLDPAPTSPSAPFFEWGFVGAPFNNICFICRHPVMADAKCCGRKIDDTLVHALAPNLVGNGGMSMRRTHAMIKALDAFCLPANPQSARPPHLGPDGAMVTPSTPVALEGATSEDVFYATALNRMHLAQAAMSVCPRTLALTFGIEQTLPSLLPPKMPWALCSHKAYGYLNAAVVERMLKSYSMTSIDKRSTWRDEDVV